VKTKERSAAGGSRASASAPHPGERLPFAPRERKPALAALAVLLILVGALGATVLVLRAGHRIDAIEVTKPVVAGQAIPPGAIKAVSVPEDSDADFLPWTARGELGKFVANVDLVEGSVLVNNMVVDKAQSEIAAGKVRVGVPVKAGQLPQGLAIGNHVAAYLVDSNGSSIFGGGKSIGSTGTEPLVQDAKVQSIESGGDSLSTSGTTVTLLVNADEAGPLASAAASQKVALAQVRGSNG
jgi:hypothetical protein